MGICAGIQSINVAFGGTLHQNIHGHSLGLDERHEVHVRTDSELYRLYGKETLMVNSLHHQAIDTLGEGLKVGAISPDGIIEEVEADNLLAVQWHPEMMDEYNFIVRFFESNT